MTRLSKTQLRVIAADEYSNAEHQGVWQDDTDGVAYIVL